VRVYVCGHEVEDGTTLNLTTSEPLCVEGDGVRGAHVEGRADLRFVRDETGVWFPPSGLMNYAREPGISILVLDLGVMWIRVVLRRQPVKLDGQQLRLMLTDLGKLAISFENPTVYTEVPTATVDLPPLKSVGISQTREEKMRALGDALIKYLPPLLDRPLRILAFESGVVRVERAKLGPQAILQRVVSPERRSILGVALRERPSLIDYSYLAGLLDNVNNYALERRRAWSNIRDTPIDQDRWAERLAKLETLAAHPVMASATRMGAQEPTWALSRSVHGGEIIAASHGATKYLQLGRARDFTAGIDNLALYPVSDHAHLYELWVFFSLVELLRTRFHFQFAEPEPRWVDDYVKYSSAASGHAGWQFCRPVVLKTSFMSVDGVTPARLRVELQHSPSLARRGAGKSELTPDIFLTVKGGERGREYETTHVLDAKFSHLDPLSHARSTAKRKYLEGLAVRPMTSFVALPTREAACQQMMLRLDRRFRGYPRRRKEWASLAASDIHGFAWGTISAYPGEGGYLGLRQFLALVFEYHRTELRHLCGQCGGYLTMEDLDVRKAGATRRLRAGVSERKLAAHRDAAIDGVISHDELAYFCPTCDHLWIRHACRHGHVLMKYGGLTPHHTRDDADKNVVCSVCGHYRGGGTWERPL
jgi:hypothetical protein